MAVDEDPSIFELSTVCSTEEAAIQFCREEGLIPKSNVKAPNNRMGEFWGACSKLKFNPALPNCKGNVTTMQRKFKNGPKPQYRCTKCGKQISQQHGLAPVGGAVRDTLFAGLDRSGRPNCKTPKRAVLWIMYALAKGLSLPQTIALVRGTIPLGKSVVIGWRDCIRQVMVEALRCVARMGGAGDVVQIGHLLFRSDRLRRPPKRGRTADGGCTSGQNRPSGDSVGPWVFGLLHEATGELRVFQVEERDPETILPIIVANVAPSSVICSNGKTAYGDRVERCRDSSENGGGPMKYSHREADLETGFSTAQLEAMLGRCKSQIVQVNKGTSPYLLPGHLAEFWWSSLNGPKKCNDPFMRLVALIRELYPQE